MAKTEQEFEAARNEAAARTGQDKGENQLVGRTREGMPTPMIQAGPELESPIHVKLLPPCRQFGQLEPDRAAHHPVYRTHQNAERTR